MLRPGENAPRETNRLAMTLAPRIDRPADDRHARRHGTASFTIDFLPTLRAGQTVMLVLGQQEFAPRAFTPPVAALNFVIPNAPVANHPGHLARLRIDGIDSPIIDRGRRAADLPNQRIKSYERDVDRDWTEANQRFLVAEFARLKAQLSRRRRARGERERA